MKNISSLVQFDYLKIQEGILNGLAAWYFSCTIYTIYLDLDLWIFSSAAPLPKLGLRAVHKFQPTFSKSVRRTGNET